MKHQCAMTPAHDKQAAGAFLPFVACNLIQRYQGKTGLGNLSSRWAGERFVNRSARAGGIKARHFIYTCVAQSVEQPLNMRMDAASTPATGSRLPVTGDAARRNRETRRSIVSQAPLLSWQGGDNG